MKTENRLHKLYPNLGFWFLGFILLVFAGFYNSYFSVLTEISENIVHFHFILLSVWIVIVIVQPFLYKYKKIPAHRLVGRLSYLVVPLAMISTLLMIKYGYISYIDRISQQMIEGRPEFSKEQIVHLAAKYNTLPFLYFFWMGILYSLGIINRKKTPVHAKYMLGTSLTLIGPTVDRIFFFVFKIDVLPFNIPVETVSFLIIDLILVALLITDQNRKTNTILNCLGIFLGGQILYFLIQDTIWWEAAMTWLMKQY